MSTTRRSSQEDEIISPDIDIDTVDPEKPQSSSFTLKMVMELKSSHIGLTPAIRNLSQTIERQRQKLDKLDDLRIEFASHKATLDRACDDLRDAKAKLDRIHTWKVGAAAVVAFLVFASQVALRVWPPHEAAPVVITAPTPTAPAAPARSR
jgi:hypothetical protein